MNKPAIPKFTVLSDHFDLQRGSVAEQDLFSLDRRLEPIFDILRHRDTVPPLALAIYGGAGTGKTTALMWLEEQVEAWNEIPKEERGGHPRVLPVWFVASNCVDGESAVRRLVAAIVFRCLENLPDETLRQEFLQLAADRCSATLGEEFIGRLKRFEAEWGLSAGTVIESGLDAGVLGWDRSYSSCLDFISRWTVAWEEAGDPVRIVPLIDDLDHCPADRMMEVFDAIASKLRSASLVFAVGVDMEVAQNLIARHYKEHGYGELQIRHYLGKVFQGECHIEPSAKQISVYYDKQFEQLNRKMNLLLGDCLSAEYKVYVDEAIMHLANSNPRKIKLLLNSAMMRAYAADRKEEPDGVPCELFAQRIQIYLLQRWLSYFSVGASAINRSDVQDWFERISKITGRDGSNYEREIGYQIENEDDEGGLRRPMRGRGSASAVSLDPPKGFGFNMVPEWVWNLLKIPFDSQMACFESVPVSELEPVAEREMPQEAAPADEVSNHLGGASDTLKDALAAVLEKSVSSLTESDLTEITHLDFSGKTLPLSDFKIIAQMEQLKRLDLYNSEIDDLSWTSELSNLERLNLTCTKVTDLTPLAGIDSLRLLDLSYTAVSDLTPLAEMHQLETLTLYGAAVDSLEGLRGMQGLARLNLSHTQIEDDDIEVCESLPALKNLFLRGTAVSQKRAADLKKSMKFALQIEI